MADLTPGARVRVRVPATSANLGPGFDALGLALDLHDELEVGVTESGLQMTPYGGTNGGSSGIPTGERNLVVRALRAALGAMGEQPPGLALAYTSTIPHSRGLGSSAAAICAGVAAGLALCGEEPNGELALQLTAELEGHPDNVAPCLLGGATIAWYGGMTDAGRPRARAVRLEPHPALRLVVFVPVARTSTEQARTALPQVITHRDAAYSAGRSALLVHALTTRPDLLFEATEDRLHQQYRLPAAPGSAHLLEILRDAGFAAVLSGSGPTILALCASESEIDRAVGLAGGMDDLAVSRPGVAPRGCTATTL